MNVAFIPVRGGSKSIPLKNIKPLCGKPLVYWTVKAACECAYIDKVYVATDSDIIKNTVETFKFAEEESCFSKIEVIGRSAESASDTASTEFAMLEFAHQYNFENIVLIQATSPLLTADDLNRGFLAFNEENTDSVLSVVPQKRFHWAVNQEGYVHPSNYDVFHRPRRQEFDGYLVENGAFYISSKEALLQSKNRLSGNIKAVEMNEDTFLEIDEPSDWAIIELLMQKHHAQAKTNVPKIQMLLTDCDGCLTDGGMYYSEQGDELKKFNTKDGMAFSELHKHGILCGIITGECVELNRRRAQKLNLEILQDNCKDKATVIKELSEKYHIDLQNIAYVGDDINDIEALKIVGFSCCPCDAMSNVKEVSHYVAKASGGHGVIREIADLILKV